MRNGFGITSLILGIVSILLFFNLYLGFILGLLAIIFGIIGIKKDEKIGFGLAGLILGNIALIIWILVWFFILLRIFLDLF